MSKVKVTCGIAVSIDGYVAGLNQSFEKPFGEMPKNLLHRWMFDEPEKHKSEIAALTDAGAYIMGNNMFCTKDKQNNLDWRGWWGDNPPYHAPVFVLTNNKRDPIVMDGGTTFHFVTDGIDSAYSKAVTATGNRKISIAGGANTVNQYLLAGLIDELWLHIVPVTIGAGARLFENVPNLKLEPSSVSGSKLVTHIRYKVLK